MFKDIGDSSSDFNRFILHDSSPHTLCVLILLAKADLPTCGGVQHRWLLGILRAIQIPSARAQMY
jgi:hypothetical protein